MLVTASTLVLFGRLGDLIGQKRVYTIGFAIFGGASLACAFSPAFWGLVAARAVQGIGSAMLMSSSPAIITDAFPGNQRGRAIGLNGAAVAVGLSTGPLLGGVIVTYWDWRWIFLINVPISAIALAVCAFVLKREQRKEERFDLAGAAIAFTTLFAISLALSRAHVWGWGSARTIGALVYAAIGVAAFLRIERRVAAPMLDLNLFKNRTFAFSILAATLFFCAMYCVVFTIPLAAQISLGKNALQAGFLLLPVSVLNVVLAPVAGALSDRIPARYVSTAGALCFLAGCALLGYSRRIRRCGFSISRSSLPARAPRSSASRTTARSWVPLPPNGAASRRACSRRRARRDNCSASPPRARSSSCAPRNSGHSRTPTRRQKPCSISSPV